MKRGILAVCTIAVMVFWLGGCRYSETIEKMIHDEVKAGLIDYDPPIDVYWNSQQNDTFDEALNDLIQRQTAERETEPEELGRKTGEEGTDTEAGYAVVAGDGNETDAEITNEPVEGTEGSGEQEKAEGSGEKRGNPGESSPDTEEEEGKDNQTGEEGETPVPDPDEDTDKQVVDDGQEEPETPDDAYTAAAAGKLAAMFVILGNADALVATDADTLAKAGEISTFSGLQSAQAVWQGDGTAGLSESGLQVLLDLKPDVVVETSGSTAFTNEQVALLESNGTAYVVVPAFDSLENINTAMTVLGELLSEKDENAPSRAAGYVDWVENMQGTLADAASGAGQQYTLYLDGWDGEAVVSEAGYSSTGCAYVLPNSHAMSQMVSSLLSTGGVTNTTSLPNFNAESNSYYYVTPLASKSALLNVSGMAAACTTSRNFALLGPVVYRLGTDSWSGGESSSVTVNLGEDGFTHIIAADTYTQNAVLQSKSEDYGQWKPYSAVASIAFETPSGFILDDNTMVISAVRGEYDVLVNPAGYESWTEGSCESILESVWAAWAVSGILSEADAKNYISGFYSEFYSETLDDTEMAAILAGH